MYSKDVNSSGRWKEWKTDSNVTLTVPLKRLLILMQLLHRLKNNLFILSYISVWGYQTEKLAMVE